MKLWVLDRLLDTERLGIGPDDLIINFTYQDVGHSNLLNLSSEYNTLRDEVKRRYVDFIAGLGNRKIGGTTIKELFLIEGSSAWWFNKITYKDSIHDSLFDDICKAILIKRIMKEKKIESSVVLTDNQWLYYLLGIKKGGLGLKVLKKFLSRIKLFVSYVIVKFIIALDSIKKCKGASRADTLFLTSFPKSWNKDMKGSLSDRFFRDLPDGLDDCGYLIYLFPLNKALPRVSKPAFFLQQYVNILEVMIDFFDLRNVFKYLLFRRDIKSTFMFEEVDLRDIYDLYMWESAIFEEYCFRLIIKGSRRLFDKIKPRQLVMVGEFGAMSRAVISAARRTGVCVTWLQHSVISEKRLWFCNNRGDILDDNGMISRDFKCQLPVADRFIVWGDRSVAGLKESWYPRDRLFVLGNPRYDSFARIKGREASVKNAVIFTPTIAMDEMLAFMKMSVGIKTHFPDRTVLIKLHPRAEELSKERSIAQAFYSLDKSGVKTVKDSIEAYYDLTNLFICGCSPIGIEASYFGAKTIVYIPRYYNRYTPYWVPEGTFVYSLEEAIDKITRPECIPDTEWSGYYLEPGCSRQAVVSLLKDRCG